MFLAPMKQIVFRLFGYAIGASCVLVLVVMFLSGPISDVILSNAIGPEDLELPPSAYPMRQTAELIQSMGGQGLGLDCSLPWGADFLAFPRKAGVSPISLRMRQACVFHDYCYRHGAATYGYTQADCDYLLQEQAFRLCTQISTPDRIEDCETEARKVTLGVRLGGWSPFRRADAPSMKDGSTYFEFDAYPLRSPQHVAVRIADAPLRWQRDGAMEKAYYVFSTKRGGSELRIIGMGASGRRWCALLRIPGSFDAITSIPFVVRSARDNSDWLVWWNRATLNNTAGSFAGLQTAGATLSDWREAVGATTGRSPRCSDFASTEEGMNDQGPDGKSRSFSGLVPRQQQRDPVTKQPIGYVEARMLVSEFVPQFPGGGTSRNAMPLALYGVTTHGCSTDPSACLAEVEIDPSRTALAALYEPYAAYDARCIPEGHRLHADALKLRGSEQCDRYRNFNQVPVIAARSGLPELVWIRRGDSQGDGYSERALLRRAPRRDSDDPSRVAQLNNFDTYALDDYPERAEPSALAGDALLSIYAVGFGPWRCVALVRTMIRGPVNEFDKEQITSARGGASESTCLPGIDSRWLGRPWYALPDGTLLLLKTDLKRMPTEGSGKEHWEIHLQVASLDSARPEHVALTQETAIAPIYSCPGRQGDAKWVLQTRPCGATGVREMARGRNEEERSNAAARVMRSAPLAVADMNSDGIPDIGFLYRSGGRDMVFLRGARTDGRIIWEPDAEQPALGG